MLFRSADVLREARGLVESGAREITLLGQNVNAFHGAAADGSTWTLGRLIRALAEIDGLKLSGTAKEKAGVVSFTMDSVHPHDIGTVLDNQGIAVRAGHHCCMPVMTRFGIPATARASFSLYNTKDEVEALVRGVKKIKELFG